MLILVSVWELFVLLFWVCDYFFVMLDELILVGEVIWFGYGMFFGCDGWVLLYFVDFVLFMLFEFEVEIVVDFFEVWIF